ncbi:hypothetical protein [Streptomonospora salina]|uniref:Uncharacterized protein n=2 Tax=Streptomonospora salina TaxID=104205 RepID=A0A841E6L8_9ACTN|nr:hypothetical protein [Streptomonospora salina]MBB5998094.1 hypothetical protein [Streptomonospora salina]
MGDGVVGGGHDQRELVADLLVLQPAGDHPAGDVAARVGAAVGGVADQEVLELVVGVAGVGLAVPQALHGHAHPQPGGLVHAEQAAQHQQRQDGGVFGDHVGPAPGAEPVDDHVGDLADAGWQQSQGDFLQGAGQCRAQPLVLVPVDRQGVPAGRIQRLKRAGLRDGAVPQVAPGAGVAGEVVLVFEDAVQHGQADHEPGGHALLQLDGHQPALEVLLVEAVEGGGQVQGGIVQP